MRTEDKAAHRAIAAHAHDHDRLRTQLRNAGAVLSTIQARIDHTRTAISYSGVREFPINPDAAPGRYAAGAYPARRPDDFAAGEAVNELYADRHGDRALWDRVDSAKLADEFARENLAHIRALHQLADDGSPHHGFVL